MRRVLVLLAGVALAGLALMEDTGRRRAEDQLGAAVAAQQQLEARFERALASYQDLGRALAQERSLAAQLTADLARRGKELDEAMLQLADQSRVARELQGRLANVQAQTEQLQGELASSLDARASADGSTGDGSVELQRIVVTDGQQSGFKGRVVSVHPEWDFIVIDLGWDAVKIGETISIYRNEQLLGKARIERVQEGVCAATVLPEWSAGAIHVNDLVRVL
ncbi:MAG: hypothetical protein HY601_00665 [Candidatus Omnitrophica bacterium]|nr:hypothetical protein [Candidatus Omnitrophota bacterium]